MALLKTKTMMLGISKFQMVRFDNQSNRIENRKIELYFMVNRFIGLSLGSRFLNFVVNGLGLRLIDLKTDG